MNRHDLLKALADAEQAIEEAGVWGIGPNGLERRAPRPKYPTPPMKIAKPRKNSKQGGRERGGVV